MPQYLTRKDNTYYFRQSVPAELRPIIGKREIKKSLGHDFAKAVSACKRYAVVADNLLADARAQYDSIPIEPFSPDGIRRTRHIPLTEVTPDLEQQVGNLVRASLLETDRNARIAGMSAEEFSEYQQHIDLGITTLRRQLSMGNVEPMMASAHQLLVGRGYDPELPSTSWRRLAYVMTEATLEAYESMAVRQAGGVVSASQDHVLPSQFEVQNAPKEPVRPRDPVTWEALYDVWVNECVRREPVPADCSRRSPVPMKFKARPTPNGGGVI